ncbi:unnamed protein product [Moneuplotes crassus]|uniref:Uncharacterized protein n=1 Tax=Euplotes crassus TaxID=5936 RepID=A0AAD1UJ46_EUPCR|nr:unnamed protein product [Moneuplotes crassus]
MFIGSFLSYMAFISALEAASISSATVMISSLWAFLNLMTFFTAPEALSIAFIFVMISSFWAFINLMIFITAPEAAIIPPFFSSGSTIAIILAKYFLKYILISQSLLLFFKFIFLKHFLHSGFSFRWFDEFSSIFFC